jgi:hypothetical protein
MDPLKRHVSDTSIRVYNNRNEMILGSVIEVSGVLEHMKPNANDISIDEL